MERYEIFQDIAERTGGDIYLGVVGPVRTGKSTFIKRFMDLMVIPNIKNPNERDRARDELPQSGAGRTIMTTEPKFIPNEAVEVIIRDGLQMKVRMVDCVGYRVEGALGYEEEDGPRMVRTPWFDDEIPFQEASEVGTRKVIADHSTIGLVITTDGSITDISRENYLDAEERVIWELKELHKPFLVILNSTNPNSAETIELAHAMEAQYDVPVIPLDCAELNQEDIMNILEEVLYEFPVIEVDVSLPRWVDELEPEHWLRIKFDEAVRTATNDVRRLRDIDGVVESLGSNEFVHNVNLQSMNLGNGIASIQMTAEEGLFHKILEEVTGYTIAGDHQLLKLMRELSVAKKEYDKVASGLQDVRNTGYGVVSPTIDEMELLEPELVRQGGRFGVKLKATAPSYHIIKANISTEITPLIGTERQAEELVKYILDEFEGDPQKIWETNMFGKSLSDLVREGIQGKLYR
ncbi:MAG: stage IV sporulation protein A, partial [Bacillota bacterium]